MKTVMGGYYQAWEAACSTPQRKRRKRRKRRRKRSHSKSSWRTPRRKSHSRCYKCKIVTGIAMVTPCLWLVGSLIANPSRRKKRIQ
jgi:hypothetical protein